ncbi:MAG: hypothetical protein AB1757_04900 [Acidobacteriota bacterium]
MKNRKQMILALVCAVTLLSSTGASMAQTAKQEKATKAQGEKDVVVVGAQAPMRERVGGVTFVSGADTFTYIASEASFGGKIVKGAPYSAQAVTENIQVLNDGNRIIQKTTQDIYRDSEGRTRQDQTIGGIGPFAAAGEPPQTVFIHDPVAGTTYILDQRSKSARKIATFIREDRPEGKEGEGATFIYKQSEGSTVHWKSADKVDAEMKAKIDEKMKASKEMARTEAEFAAGVAAGAKFDISADGSHFRVGKMKREVTTESLGTQNIEGVMAEGKRTTFTIPAGEIGNERPINVVTEEWYSPELQVVVMRKHTDPRQGEMTYRLTNINRLEPARSLFEVPADYTVKESVSPKMKLDLEREMVREKVKRNNEQ